MKIMKRPPEWNEEKFNSPESYWNRPEIIGDLNETKKNIDDKEMKYLMDWIIAGMDDDSKIGDFGCGNGRIAATICKDKLLDIVAIDCSEGLIDVAHKKCGDSKNVSFICDKIQNVELKDKLDVIIIIDVLQHCNLKDKAKILESIQKNLKKDGMLFVCERTDKNYSASNWISEICLGTNFVLIKYEDAFYLFKKETE